MLCSVVCVLACCCCCRCGLSWLVCVVVVVEEEEGGERHTEPSGCWFPPKLLSGEPLKHVITLRGQILVSRTGDDTLPPPRVSVQKVPVCTFKTSPRVPAPRALVEKHVRVLPAYSGREKHYRYSLTGFQFSENYFRNTSYRFPMGGKPNP